MQLSDHFTLEEATISQTASRNGIDNSNPSPDIIIAATKTATRLEKVRALLGNIPLNVDSWIRCLELNRALGSKDTSQHLKGEAVDFICPAFGTPNEICKKIVANKEVINFDQLILEHTWVHISWNSTPNAVQRNQVLSLLESGLYASGLTDKSGNAIT
jgi:zinc D-Ala-D-Ala carboxypeptidase